MGQTIKYFHKRKYITEKKQPSNLHFLSHLWYNKVIQQHLKIKVQVSRDQDMKKNPEV